VQLDSMFEPAWVRLSLARINLYGNAVPDPALGEQARVAAERARQLNPNDPMVYRAFGAYHGSVPPVDLMRARGGVRASPPAGARQLEQLVRIYLATGQTEKALDELETLLKVPYDLSPGWLRIDPTFDPLRSNPRFKKLVEGAASPAA